jgi:hypothetical protein
VAQVGGVWDITETITGVTGGECFSGAFQATVGNTGRGTLQITQNGASLSIRATDLSTGASCDHTGTAGATSIATNVVSCTASDALGATCPNGARRDIRLVTGGYNGTVSGSSANGTGAQTYNIVVSGTGTGVGTLTITSRFTATRR